MRDFGNDRSQIAINSATVKGCSLEQLVDGCARIGISAIAPWRDVVQACGVESARPTHPRARHDGDLPLRGGMFPAADEAGAPKPRSTTTGAPSMRRSPSARTAWC